MPDPALLQLASAPALKPYKYVPICTQTFFTGLVTQRSPFSSLDNRYNRRFLGGRPDQLFDGLNCELSNAATVIRRPGFTQYSSAILPGPVNSFYSFKLLPVGNTPGAIQLMADTHSAVYQLTPTAKTLIFTKAAGAGQNFFQGVGNTLYMGDGIEQRKLLRFADQWVGNTEQSIGSSIVDANGNIQQLTSIVALASHVNVTSNVLTITCNNALVANTTVLLSTFATSTFLNGQRVTVSTSSSTQFTAAFTHANVDTADTGTVTDTTPGDEAPTGLAEPVWSTTVGQTTNDGGNPQLVWTMISGPLQQWGINTPVDAPTVANTPFPSQLGSWVASTFYSPALLLYDTNNNIQLLTTAGTTGASQPSWNMSGTTSDNTAVWTFQGQAAWQASHSYAVGAYVAGFVTYSGSYRIPGDGIYNYSYAIGSFFKCTAAGTSGTVQPHWSAGVGTTIIDNGVTWANVGGLVQWTATIPGAIGIGASALVSTNTSILDSNGNVETILYSGKSGGTAPTWKTVVGGITTDGTITWTNQGPESGNQASGTAAYQYLYSFKNSITGHVSTASPVSASITLAADSFITVQGDRSTDPQVDTVEIFRTKQGGSVFNFLADIPNPPSGNWTFNDTTPDANLNVFLVAPQSESNDPPPTGLVKMTYHLNKVWGAVGSSVYFSAGPDATIGNGSEAFPPANVFEFPTEVNRLIPVSAGLLVFTLDDIYIIIGTATANLYSQLFQQGTGLSSYNAIDVQGEEVYLYTSDKQFVSVSSSGVDQIGFPIGNLLQSTFMPGSVYVASLISGTYDQAVFIGDGVDDWFRCNPNQPPEGGPAWSPLATITGGATAMAALETSPGVHQLLVAQTNGTVIARDSSFSTFSDNGQPYAAYATIGSLVLAQPGQLCEVESVTLELPKVGSLPQLSVLWDEIGGSFEALPYSTNDPPQLSISETLYSQRWYLNQSQLPAIGRHMQLKITFASEAAKNELYTLSIFGALRYKET